MNLDDDYELNDSEDIEEEAYYQPPDEEDEESDGGVGDEEESPPKKVDTSIYQGRLTKTEIELSSSYDDIVNAGKTNKDSAIEDAATIVVWANPKHTSATTVGNILKELFHKQGHSRMVNSIYTPDSALRGEDVDLDFNMDDDASFNRKFAQEARDQIARFVDYLATRDLSKDSVISRRRKERQLPAFIIFLFSSGMYDLIMNCPTMPKEYADQIERAFERLTKTKYDIVEDLARRYEEMGRQKVADKVRKAGLSWFDKEPAEIRTAAEYADLDLTYDDVIIYREYRAKFMNSSKVITQDVISDLIEVVIDPEAGVYEKLKDKTRAEAIADVKQTYKAWAKDNPVDSDLATKVIWKDVNSLKV